MKYINRETALDVAENLLQIKAVKLSPQKPFTWTSGWKSPIYCDNRKTLSYPKIRTFIRQELTNAILETYGKPDVIAGVATGAIAHGVLVAQQLGVPFIYVRSSPKQHGLTSVIEGVYNIGQSVVVVEDLISTGKSSLYAVSCLREAECLVKGMVAIFTYNFKVADEAFKTQKCDVITLTNYNILIEKAIEIGYITKQDLVSLQEWRENPEKWGEKFTTVK